MIRYFGEQDDCRLLVVNLGLHLFPNPTSEPLTSPPLGKRRDALWYSEHPRYGGGRAPPLETDTYWRVPGRTAIVLHTVPKDQSRA